MVSEKTENNNEETGNTVTRKTRSEIERAEKTRIALEAINNDDWLHIPDVVFKRFSNEGYTLAWIRISLKGKQDYQSIGLKQREGWEFVTETEAPEMAQGFRVLERGDLEGTIVRGDVALAKRPIEIDDAVRQAQVNKTRQMDDAIYRRLMESSDSRVPITNSSKSRVSKGRSAHFDS